MAALKLKAIAKFLRGEEAATAVEYSVMLALIIMACLGTIITVGQQASQSWNRTSSSIQLVTSS